MEFGYPMIGGILLAALLLILINNFRRERPKGTTIPTPKRPEAPFPSLSQRVMEIASDPGRKISAIKAYREETGLGLKEAKDAVEAWLAGGGKASGGVAHAAAYTPSASATGASFEPTLSQHVKDIARDPGGKISAIKAYREETGAGLKDAKDAVEAWRRSQGLE
jgi:ribosomal protein L7/L12